MQDLKKVNKIIKFLKTTHNNITIPSVDLSKCYIAAFSDASFANLHDGGSQGGDIILLADDDRNVAVLAWSSTRIKRVVKSTLSAESLQFSDTVDSSFFLNSLLEEIMRVEPNHFLPTRNMTDSLSLYETYGTYTLCPDKRHRVDLSAIQEAVRNQQISITYVYPFGTLF